MTQSIIVAILVVAAVAWAIWTIVRRTRRGGCASCASGASCPFANRGVCPSETPEDVQVCDEIREEQREMTTEEERTIE